MTKDEALKLALKFVEDSECGTADLEAHIKEALAQPEQEPVQTTPSFAQLQQIITNLEHCLLRDSKQEFLRVWIRDWTEHKLSQNTPPQRTWVGLTDEEAMQICVDCGCLSEDWLTLLDAIEAKLKEKNT